MKIVIIGGSGLIGTKLVNKLRQLGHNLVAASPSTGVNTVTGEGLDAALQGAEVVVDVANSPSFEDKAVLAFFETSGKNLLAAATAAGVKHFIALSVVGTEHLQGSGYFRAKLAQEQLIKAAAIPYTIVHATQFFEFVGGIAHAGTTGNEVHISPAFVQPMASEDVATALAKIAVAAPLNGTTEIAGPDKLQLDNLVRKYLGVMKDARQVETDVHAPYFGVELNEDSLVPGNNVSIGKIRYDEWISEPANQR